MKVLSLFDGISCGYLALKRAGIFVDKYYASEIDKKAILVSKANHPEIIHLGDVESLHIPSEIDLLIGGSPCQGFSNSGKMLNFKDPRSKLFFEFVRILKETKPKYFLLENVVMKQEWQDIISEYLGVKPILIDSSLFSAQSRPRLYWTNIPISEIPKNQGQKFSEVIGGVSAAMRGRRIDHNGKNTNDESFPIRQYIECRKDDLGNCMTTAAKNSLVVDQYSSRVLAENAKFRYITPEEAELLQTLPVGYTKSAPKTQRLKMIGNSWTVNVISFLFKNLKNL